MYILDRTPPPLRASVGPLPCMVLRSCRRRVRRALMRPSMHMPYPSLVAPPPRESATSLPRNGGASTFFFCTRSVIKNLSHCAQNNRSRSFSITAIYLRGLRSFTPALLSSIPWLSVPYAWRKVFLTSIFHQVSSLISLFLSRRPRQAEAHRKVHDSGLSGPYEVRVVAHLLPGSRCCSAIQELVNLNCVPLAPHQCAKGLTHLQSAGRCKLRSWGRSLLFFSAFLLFFPQHPLPSLLALPFAPPLPHCDEISACETFFLPPSGDAPAPAAHRRVGVLQSKDLLHLRKDG